MKKIIFFIVFTVFYIYFFIILFFLKNYYLVEKEYIPFNTKTTKSPFIQKDWKIWIKVGENGYRNVVQNNFYLLNKKIKQVSVFKSEILKKPEDALVILGESEKKHPITVPQETYVHYTYNLEATAYDPSPESNSLEWAGITKLGWRTRYGIAAVDPKVIALRSLLYIEGYGFASAGDTGGAIKGKRIDLCYNTTEEALKWGRRKTKVYVLGKKPLNTKKD